MFKRLGKTTNVVLAAGVLGLLISGYAVGATGDPLLVGKKTTAGTDKQTVMKTNNDKSGFNGYGFRVQNKAKKNGGGALMSCYTPDAGCFYGTNKSTTGGPGVKARANKGSPLLIDVPTGNTSAPISTNSSVRVANLNVSNSAQLEGQGPDRYAAVGARVDLTGNALSPPTAYGLDTTQGGGDGVQRNGAGTGNYTVFLTSPSDQYLVQVTPTTVGIRCAVTAVSNVAGNVTVDCTTDAGAVADTGFYFSATKP